MKIAFIGAGKMASALMDGLIKAGICKPENIWATRRSQADLETLKSRFGIQITTNNIEAVSQVDVVMLAVKPHFLPEVLTELNPIINEKKPLVISVASGITCESISNMLGGNIEVVRAMPNTPVAVGQGMTALYRRHPVKDFKTGSSKTEKSGVGGEGVSVGLCQKIFNAVGQTLWLEDEDQMDAVAALSGSGPAYFFAMMEAMINAGVTLGLPREMANNLTIQTALGSASMALLSGNTPTHLREQVAPKGGGTELALQVMHDYHFGKMMLEAMSVAKKKYESMRLLK